VGSPSLATTRIEEVAALHWNEAASDEDTNVFASGFPGAGLQSSVADSAENVQFMVKDSKKYAATGRLGICRLQEWQTWRRGAAQNLLPLPPAFRRSRLRLHPLRAYALSKARLSPVLALPRTSEDVRFESAKRTKADLIRSLSPFA
jgi:hypothetical protein